MNKSNNTYSNESAGQSDKADPSGPIPGMNELHGEVQNVFKKASEISLTADEKAKGAEALKAFMAKNVPAALSSHESPEEASLHSPAPSGPVESPYAAFSSSVSSLTSELFSKNPSLSKVFVFASRHKGVYAFAAACFIFIFATGTTYAAGGSLPGDLLYPVKININEPVQRALAIKPEAKARVIVKQAVTRLKEAEQLAVAGKINQSNEVAINAGLARSSDEVQHSVAALSAHGQTDAAVRISADYENSLKNYEKNIDSISLAIAETATGTKDALLKIRGQIRDRIVASVNARTEFESKLALSSDVIKAKELATATLAISEQDLQQAEAHVNASSAAKVMAAADMTVSANLSQAQDKIASARKTVAEGKEKMMIGAYSNATVLFKAAAQDIAAASMKISTTSSSTASTTGTTTIYINVGGAQTASASGTANAAVTAAASANPVNTITVTVPASASANGTIQPAVQVVVPASSAVTQTVNSVTNALKGLGI